MKKINLSLSIEEVNAILQALGNMPYAEVHELIQTIHTQANQQLNGNESATEDNTEET